MYVCMYVCISSKQVKVGDVFIGYHADTAASLVLQIYRTLDRENDSEKQVCLNNTTLLLFYIKSGDHERCPKLGPSVDKNLFNFV